MSGVFLYERREWRFETQSDQGESHVKVQAKISYAPKPRNTKDCQQPPEASIEARRDSPSEPVEGTTLPIP